MATVSVDIKSPTGSPQDTTIVVAGQDLTKYLQSIDVHCDSDSMFTVNASAIAHGVLDITLQAEVTVVLQSIEGFDIVAELQEDGSTRYRTIRTRNKGDGCMCGYLREQQSGDR